MSQSIGLRDCLEWVFEKLLLAKALSGQKEGCCPLFRILPIRRVSIDKCDLCFFANSLYARQGSSIFPMFCIPNIGMPQRHVSGNKAYEDVDTPNV